MHVNAKKVAFTGVLAAFAVILLVLSAVIETSSLFLIAAAAFCVGIVLREWGIRAGAAFLTASFLVGLIVAPNRLYCITFLAMGIYLVLSEILWEKVAQSSKIQKKTVAVWIGKYIIFNAMFIPVLLIFPTLILEEEAVEKMFWIVLIGAQAGLFVFDKAYMYFQIFIWGKLRSKVMK